VIGSDPRPLERFRHAAAAIRMLTRDAGVMRETRASANDRRIFRLRRGRRGQSALMTIGTSLFLIAVGAILKYAVTAHVAGVDLNVVGVILMIVGVVGLLLGLGMWISARNEMRRTPPPPPGAY
jgi:hypothetical protein